MSFLQCYSIEMPHPPPPSQILHNLCFSFFLGITFQPREIEYHAYAIFLEGRGGGGGANRVYNGRCANGKWGKLSEKMLLNNSKEKDFNPGLQLIVL